MKAGYFRLMAFPVEIQDCIFQELEVHELPIVLRVNSHFNAIATRILYRIIPELPIRRCIACLKVLCSNPANAALVRKLSIDWSNHRVVANLFRLLRDTLTHLTSLRHLSIELSPQDNHYSLAWVLHGCRSRLRTPGHFHPLKVKEFPQWFGEVCDTIGLEIGWIGWFPVGGLDENGEIKAIFPSVGGLHGVTFEEWLAKKIGWTCSTLLL
ncbi:hypothetical protein NUW54_g7527 [Trametes sanguinea]|uniref:Uncharacterized protein n=1 Tax=Trametes sanguinea TaxID=158606 RepID=A0ACC1PL89_9APHY|nr:hypothetical protein NUW54_g7527 [Trametes sanguinea]